MLPILMEELARVVHGANVSGRMNAYATGVVVDSQRVSPGDVFVAFVGQSVNGHKYVADAVARGASAVLVTEAVEPVDPQKTAVIRVNAPLAAIHRLAMHDRARFTGPVIGVTGSNGKTTTKEMLACVFRAAGPCLFTEGNMNTELGLPLTLLRRVAANQSIILEMGMRGLGQIAELCQVASPTAGIITNIGQSHMELLGTQENIALAKAELLDYLPATGYAALSANDPWLRKMADRTSARVLWYDILDPSESPAEPRVPESSLYAWATDLEGSSHGISFTVHLGNQSERVDLPTFGRHNVRNALGAVAIGAAHGLSLKAMADALLRLQTTSGRLNLRQGKNGVTIVDDCYNASPLSMKASLDVLLDIKKNRPVVAILGEMYELGDLSEVGHREVGAYARQLKVDIVLCIGPMARWIAQEAADGHIKVLQAASREEALDLLEDTIPPDSAVLVKASRGMGLEAIVTALEE